jgi:transcriptional antiterminator
MYTPNHEILRNLPPSAQLVYQKLQERDFINSRQLISETRYSPRTIRYALNQLINVHLIKRIHDIKDARRCYYTIVREISPFSTS